MVSRIFQKILPAKTQQLFAFLYQTWPFWINLWTKGGKRWWNWYCLWCTVGEIVRFVLKRDNKFPISSPNCQITNSTWYWTNQSVFLRNRSDNLWNLCQNQNSTKTRSNQIQTKRQTDIILGSEYLQPTDQNNFPAYSRVL